MNVSKNTINPVYYTEERENGTYYIPRGIWHDACELHPDPEESGGRCSLCRKKEERLYPNGLCQNCSIFDSAKHIAENRGTPLTFIPS